jgi:hypothetical protein
VAFLKFLLIFTLTLWSLSLLARLLLPFAIRHMMKRLAKMTGTHPPGRQAERPEGSVHIKGPPPSNSRYRPDEGEYVDYEEIK